MSPTRWWRWVLPVAVSFLLEIRKITFSVGNHDEIKVVYYILKMCVERPFTKVAQSVSLNGILCSSLEVKQWNRGRCCPCWGIPQLRTADLTTKSQWPIQENTWQVNLWNMRGCNLEIHPYLAATSVVWVQDQWVESKGGFWLFSSYFLPVWFQSFIINSFTV